MTRKIQEDQVKLSSDSRRNSSKSISALSLATRHGQLPNNLNFVEAGGIPGRIKGLPLSHCCSKLRLRIEREDGGNLLIGGLSLANNCQAILVIFGFFFIFAGVVLTIISYKTSLNSQVAESSSTREQGKICGPIFLVIGSLLFVVGTVLSLINWKLHREAKIERNRFSLEGLPGQSRTSSTSPADDAQSHLNYFNRSSKLTRFSTPNASSSFPNSRRGSIFQTNYFMGRRRTLPTVSQAVPIGALIDGKVTGHPGNFSANVAEDNGNTEGNREPSITSRRKASLSLRASLPIPLLGSPNFMRVRTLTPVEGTYRKSDEPFGSIVSLSGTGDIACFPAQSPRLPPLHGRQDEMRPSQLPFFQYVERSDTVTAGATTAGDNRPFQNGGLTPPFINYIKRELPVITVNDVVDPLITKSPARQPNICFTTHLPNSQNDGHRNRENLNEESIPPNLERNQLTQ